MKCEICKLTEEETGEIVMPAAYHRSCRISHTNTLKALLREAYPVIKQVADAHVTHGEKYWSLRDRVARAIGEE